MLAQLDIMGEAVIRSFEESKEGEYERVAARLISAWASNLTGHLDEKTKMIVLQKVMNDFKGSKQAP